MPEPPGDPSELTPVESRLLAGTELFRVHAADLPANVSNPHHGSGGRFHFFDDATGRQVPALYAAATPEAAVTEAIFREIPIRARAGRTLSKEKLEHHAVSAIRVRRDLRLVELHHPGLAHLGLEPHELTTTLPGEYERTRRWARALHSSGPWHGLVWMARLYNTVKAYFFFGDRVSTADVEILGSAYPLKTPPGLAFVYTLAEQAGITITEE